MSLMRQITLTELRERLRGGQFNRWLDVNPVSIDQDGITLEMLIRAEMLGSPITGAAHGGIVAALVDIACAFAWLAHHRGRIATIDLRVDYHRPLVPGIVRLHGTLVRAGRSIVTADARLFAGDERICASGRATMKPYLDSKIGDTPTAT